LQTCNREQFKKEIHYLRDKHKIGGEFKWKKISPSKLDFYSELIDWFFNKGDELRFRSIIINKDHVNLKQYHDNDHEMGFYKFYYQLLHHWIYDNNSYNIFCDYKSNRRCDRWEVLQNCLNNANLFSLISNVQAVRSEESVLIQLVDVLIGIVSAKFNSDAKGAKSKLIIHSEKNLGHTIIPTSRSESKFNIFKIILEGGW
jgi:hypothetical protein